MPSVAVTIEVERPAADVFAYATDPSRFSEWQKGVLSGGMTEPGPVRLGGRCVTVRRIGFAERSFTSVIAHLEPPKTWGVRGIDGPIRAIVDVSVEPLGERSSRLSITVDFEGRGIGKVLVPLVIRREARKEMPANLAALKRRIEGSA
jgi:hypothetical protein